MYPSFTGLLRDRGIRATPSHLLDLLGGIDEGLAPTMGRLYILAKATYVKDPSEDLRFQKAFFHYFLGIPTDKGDADLRDLVLNSTRFKKWQENSNRPSLEDPVQEFIEYLLGEDVQRIAQPFVDRKHLRGEDPNQLIAQPLPASDPGGYTVPEDITGDEVDYSEISDERLEDKLKELINIQTAKHEGGTGYIGRKGSSPFGSEGFSKYGIRLGGKGVHGTARAVIGGSKSAVSSVRVHGYEGADMQRVLEDLKRVEKDGKLDVLDIARIVRMAGKRGIIEPFFTREEKDKMEVILFIDNGGRSMGRHTEQVEKLFSKMHNQLNSVDTFYFHNCIYNHFFSDRGRSVPVPLDSICERDSETRVFIVGDAAMHPNRELNIETLSKLKRAFPYSVWLNPHKQNDWRIYESAIKIEQIYPMFHLSTEGLAEAVAYLTKAQNTSSIK